ncbi:MAG: Rrf2 family transcriptional regulator [Atopobiaceae bacterium]|nr:Rrf2 family transcriptional regulator [Atopobiaceae bacterium]
MRYSTRLPVATHILLCIALLGGEHKTTSAFLAGSVGVNPVVVRNVLGQLKAAGIVSVEPGVGGASLAREPERISLLDVFRAVEGQEGLFRLHDNPNPACPVGRNVHAVLGKSLAAVDDAMEAQLAATTLRELMDATSEREAMRYRG